MKVFLLLILIITLVSCREDIAPMDPPTNLITIEDTLWVVDDTVEEVLEEDDVVDEYADWAGEYYTDDNKMLDIVGPSETGWVDVDLSYDDINCVGLWLLANLEKSGVANFYSETTSCIMNFTYNPWVVEVNSYQCEDYEDAICGSFTGIYKLK
jgi:hypothetical protein